MSNPVPTCRPCGPVCDRLVFDRVVVQHLIRGQSRIAWTLMTDFVDPGPLTFQLQVGTTAFNASDDWQNVGLPVDDQYFAIDSEQRVYGMTNWTHYRVKLTTAAGTYYSEPTNGMGILARRDWRLARNILRTRRVAYGLAAQEGYLLKRRWTGDLCPVCTDPQTDEVRDPNCLTCWGTGYRCGYYYPAECVWASMRPKSSHTELDGGRGRGTIADVFTSAEMLATYLMSEEDIWVNAKTDDRWFVHKVSETANWRGMPLIADVELRLVPYTHVIYDIRIPQQLIAAGADE